MADPFRTTASDAPLILLQSPFLRALQRKSGRQLWVVVVDQAETRGTFPGRLFPTEGDLFLVTSERVFRIEPMTGKIIKAFDLPFVPDAALFDGECFFVSNLENAAAIDLDGKTRWSAAVEQGRAGQILVCRDARNRILWQEDHLPSQFSTASAGMAVAGTVAQPDAKGRV